MNKRLPPGEHVVTVRITLAELIEAHTGLYHAMTQEFPYGHLGAAFCPCPLALAYRDAIQMPEQSTAEVEAHRKAVEVARATDRERR